MKKLLLLLLVLLYPVVSFAEIDERKTDIYFANGIMSDNALRGGHEFVAIYDNWSSDLSSKNLTMSTDSDEF